jgi:hypothetical protein
VFSGVPARNKDDAAINWGGRMKPNSLDPNDFSMQTHRKQHRFPGRTATIFVADPS